MLAYRAGLQRTSNAFRTCMFLTWLIVILHVIGFSTNYWVVLNVSYYTVRSGLWRHCYCILSVCQCYNVDHDLIDDDWKEVLHGFSDDTGQFNYKCVVF